MYNICVKKNRGLPQTKFKQEDKMTKILEKMAEALVKVGENVSGAHYMISKK